MLSVALARAAAHAAHAAHAGHEVCFTTCEDMTRWRRRAIAEHSFAYGMRALTSPRLLVVDLSGVPSHPSVTSASVA
jgi:hypothetical protein